MAGLGPWRGREPAEAGTWASLIQQSSSCSQCMLPGLKSLEDFIPGCKRHMSVPVPQAASQTQPLVAGGRSQGVVQPGGRCPEKGGTILLRVGPGSLPKVRWGRGTDAPGMRSSLCADGSTPNSLLFQSWGTCHSFVHLICSVSPKSQLGPDSFLGSEGSCVQGTGPSQGPGLAS